MKINKETGCIESTIGFTCSCFDLLHAGHILMLEDSKQQCDYLIVGLQVDPSVDRNSKNSPVQTLVERYAQLKAISYVDENMKGSLGIMLDDILASVYSILILTLIFFFVGG